MAGKPTPQIPVRQKSLLRMLAFLLVWAALGVMVFLAFKDNGQTVVQASQEVRECATEGDCRKMPVLKTGEPIYRFVAFGDWGAGTPFQRDVANQMARVLKETPFDMALLLGDNIYPNGNIRKYAVEYFEKPYKPLIDAKVRFVVALGNHDVLAGYGKDQKAYFKMPHYFYQVHKNKDLHVFVINSNNFAASKLQQHWLDTALKNSKAPWKIVMGHHPIYTSGEHGSNPGLKKTLQPLLEKYHVDLYLAGHDHDYERFKPINGVQYIVSGGAGAYLRDFEKPLPQSLVRIKAHHFLFFELQDGVLTMKAIDKTGKVIDTAHWTKQTDVEKLPKAS